MNQVFFSFCFLTIFDPLTNYQTTNFRLFQNLKEFADDNFKFDENGRKLSKRVENTVGKGEIARYEQFLLFPQCFLKRLVSQGRQSVSLCGNGLKIKPKHVAVIVAFVENNASMSSIRYFENYASQFVQNQRK